MAIGRYTRRVILHPSNRKTTSAFRSARGARRHNPHFFGQIGFELGEILYLTLPNYNRLPSHPAYKFFIRSIIILISFLLVNPKLDVGFRNSTLPTAMTMPKTSVDKHNRFMPGQDDIRFAGERLHVQPKPKPEPMQYFSDSFFRLSVFAANSAHQPATMLTR